MQLDDLKLAWKKEISITNSIPNFEGICDNAEKFDRKSQIAWAIEIITCAVIIIFIAAMIFMRPEPAHPLFYIGTGSMIICSIYVAWKIYHSRRISTKEDWTLSTKLNIHIEKREKEAKLLRSITSWYIAPILIAIFLASYGGYRERTGSYTPDIGLLIYWAICIGFAFVIYALNQYKLKTKIEPILKSLYVLKKELEQI
ncbi:MAG: hypothetical protein K6L73_14500 [Cellvibrionaceae bacterium]